jgi:ATP phosphoribosyltransferase
MNQFLVELEVEVMVIELAVPNKGRLREPTLRALTKAGVNLLDKDKGILYARTTDPEIRLIFVRAIDIPRFVEEGAADLGISGHDYIVDSQAQVKELLDLKFGHAKVVIAVPDKSPIKTIDDIKPGARVATKLMNLTRSYFEAKQKQINLIKISGAAEVMPHLGVADVIVYITSPGATLKTHGLRIVDEILDTSARLIANKQSFIKKRAKIREFVLALESAMRAEKKKLVMMNVPDKALQIVTMILPSMAGPTIAKVEAPEPMWEVYGVMDEQEIYKVINSVKKAGARDILVIPIERIVP